MAFESFRNYCPKCGDEIKLVKNTSGNFVCSKCSCEFTHNWRAWLIIGLPFVACAAAPWLISSKLVMSILLGVCILAIGLSPHWFRIARTDAHGRTQTGNRGFHLPDKSVRSRLIVYLVPLGTFLILVELAAIVLDYVLWKIGASDARTWELNSHRRGLLVLVAFLVTLPGYVAMLAEIRRKSRRERGSAAN